jgi:hypothetical protein
MIRELLTYHGLVLENVSNNTLILLDLDNNIIVHEQQILRDGNCYHRGLFFDIIEKKKGHDFVTELWKKSKIRILDNAFLPFFEKYKHNCTGLTARRTGQPSATSDEKVEDKLNQELQELYITLEPHNTKEKEFLLNIESDSMIDTIYSKFYKETGPMYKHGIIFTANINKGHVLDQYIKTTNQKPDLIYFFDDKKKNLQDIMTYCVDNNIPFIGFHNQYHVMSGYGAPIPDHIINILQQPEHSDRDIVILIKYYETNT